MKNIYDFTKACFLRRVYNIIFVSKLFWIFTRQRIQQARKGIVGG